MALAIDASSPAIATQTNNTTATVSTASFTPPAGSTLLVLWSCDAAATPSAPSITDNLGTPLTYTRTDWQSISDSPTAGGQAAAWTAPVGSSAAMTVTVTSGSASGERIAALCIRVITGADAVTPAGAHGKNGSKSASSIAQSYTAQATGGWGFTAVCDFDQVGAETAGTGCTLIGSANVGTAITYAFNARTSADDSNGSSNTLNTTLPGTSTNLSWVYVEVVPASTAASIPPPPLRSIQGRDPGETWWIQRDRRDANTVATAANPLPSPLDSAWQAGARYWHLYGDSADAAPRTWQSLQRNYTSDPSMLVSAATVPFAPARPVSGRDPGEVWWQQRPGRDPAALGQPQLENELLGGADTAKRYGEPATHAARWWMPQQPARSGYTPGLLDQALLEDALLGRGDNARHAAAAAYCDRREMPQQRPYISDPSFYPTTAPTDPLTVAWGAGGPLWWLYNTAAAQVDRRLVPQQRRYLSDPAVLATALLEGPLLGGADDARRRQTGPYGPRPVLVLQRSAVDLTVFAPIADPLLVGAGVGGTTWRLYNTAAYGDRRRTAAQPPRWTVYVTVPVDVAVPGLLAVATRVAALGTATQGAALSDSSRSAPLAPGTAPNGLLAPRTTGGDA